jgi:hypothetical protein
MKRTVSLRMRLLQLFLLILAALLTTGSAKAQGAGEKVYKANAPAATAPELLPLAKRRRHAISAPTQFKNESDQDWSDIIVKGKNKMPAYDRSFSEAEVKDVVAYIRGLCKK